MRLTAVIPCKDRARNLSLCLASINACRPRPRVVLVDFGSEESLEPYGRRYPWVEVVRVEEGTEQFHKARAMNIGLKRVQTSFVVATDADQIFAPDFFGHVQQVLADDSSRLVLCYTHYLTELPEWLSPATVGERYDDLLELAKAGRQPYGEGCCNGVPTSWAKAIRGWDEEYVGFGAEDSDFMLRASLCGLRRLFIHHGTSMIHLPHPKSGGYYDPALFSANRARYHSKERSRRIVANLGAWGLERPRERALPVVLGFDQGPVMEQLGSAGGFEGVAFPHRMVAERELLAAVEELQPAAIVFDKDGRPEQRLARRICEVAPQTAMVMRYGDFRDGVPREVGELAEFLTVLQVTHRSAKVFREFESIGIPVVGEYFSGFNPRHYRPAAGPRTRDVFFGGSNRGNRYPLSAERRRLVTAFCKHFDLDLRGEGWSMPNRGPVVFGAAHNRAMQDAKLTLGMNHYDVPGYYSDRFVKSLAAGRLHLTRYIPGMEADFENHVELVWFRSVDEAIDLAEWYLRHDAERERIGACGRLVAEEMFTYRRDAERLAADLRKAGVR